MMMGTPQYMAPEQAQDAARVGPESDLYALGVILFELLAGRRPFDGTNMMAVLVDVVTKPPPELKAARPDLPQALIDLVMRLLQKTPEARPRSAAEVAETLASLLS
jgi:serine/threonine protein kinase